MQIKSFFTPIKQFQNQCEPILIGIFHKRKKTDKLRKLTLFQNLILMEKGSNFEIKKILRLDFHILYYIKRMNKTLQAYGIQFINLQNQEIYNLYSENPQLVQMWSDFMKEIINRTGIEYYYSMHTKLGSGVSGYVYLGQRKKDGEKVAIKAQNKKEDQKIIKGFINEIKVMRKLNHKNIVKIKQVFVEKEYIFVILEYLNGGTLYNKLLVTLFKEQNPNLSFIQRKKITRDILKGLQHMHCKRIIHRDIKMENILVRNLPDNQCEYVIADFGLANWLDQQQYIFKKCGTPGYIAPQILQDQNPKFNIKGDIFSVGIIFHILLTGKSIYGIKTNREILIANKECKFDFNQNIYNGQNYYGLQLLKMMLDKNPQLRISATSALKYPYLHEIQQDFNKKTIKNKIKQKSSSLNKNKEKYFQRQKLKDKSFSTQKSNSAKKIDSSQVTFKTTKTKRILSREKMQRSITQNAVIANEKCLIRTPILPKEKQLMQQYQLSEQKLRKKYMKQRLEKLNQFIQQQYAPRNSFSLK